MVIDRAEKVLLEHYATYRTVDDYNTISSGYGRVFLLRPVNSVTASLRNTAPLFSIHGKDKTKNEIMVGHGGCFTWEQPVGYCYIGAYSMLCDLGWIGGGIADMYEVVNCQFNVENGQFYYFQVHGHGSMKESSWSLRSLDADKGRMLVTSDFKPVTFPK